MPRMVLQSLSERKKQEAIIEQRIAHTLATRGKALESCKRDRKQKKKSVGELLGLLDCRGVAGTALRPANTYIPKSYNLERQLHGLISHMFVRYRVPGFLYQAFLQDAADPFHDKHEMYRQWFVTLAQGGSFSKLVKGFMTSKEAYLFLSAPMSGRIHENVWWAKMTMAGLPTGIIQTLIERVFSHYFFYDPPGNLAEVIQFYGRFHRDMNRMTFGEVTDFVAWKLRQDRTFSLNGRTVASVVKLTNEWHVLIQKAKLSQNVEWKGLPIEDWEFEARDQIWTVCQLRDNRELVNEGRKQKHCVYSYVQWCVAGRSAIFSLRGYRKRIVGYDAGQVIWDRSMELTRVTIEVSSQRAVVQIRGPLNRLPTEDEKRILRHWAGEKGLVLQG